MLHTLTYVSKSEIDPATADAIVSSIVDESIGKNASAGLTGALIFTGKHFVQVLEGQQAAIAVLMRRVQADQRHSGLKIVGDQRLACLRFSKWSMAYLGPSQFVDRHVRRLIARPFEVRPDALSDWLEKMLMDYDRASIKGGEIMDHICGSPEPLRFGALNMQRLLYCSESLLDPKGAAGEISALVSESKRRNGARGISGALISTNRFFAQALEGEAGCVAQLMQKICSDPRHHRVTIVHTDNINVRRFANWEMAYCGDAGYINSPIETLLTARAPSEKAKAVQHIYDLMMEFTKPQPSFTRFSVPLNVV